VDKYIEINESNIETEHICCAISDKKCSEGYALKKDWLKSEINNAYTFYRLNERAKVFIEYGPAENAWVPITANEYININCFWVSGKYKGNGHAKELLKKVEEEAEIQDKNGIVTVVGKNKYHFMSDGKWFKKQGFIKVDETKAGFVLLEKKLKETDTKPFFNKESIDGECQLKTGITVYYSNRCPYTEYHVQTSLKETAENRKLPLNIIKISTLEEAKSAPTPATIFSLFYKGKFLTTDISVCMESRFDKFWSKNNL